MKLLMAVLIPFFLIEKPLVINPEKITENLELTGYEIVEAYKISNDVKIIVGKPSSDTLEDQGLRIILLENEEKKYESKGKGASFIYKPVFYKFADGTILIACQHGFEYSTGVDVFELKNKQIRKLGMLSIAKDDRKPSSIIPVLTIERNKDAYSFLFTGNVIINPGGQPQYFDGSILKGVFYESTGSIAIMMKN